MLMHLHLSRPCAALIVRSLSSLALTSASLQDSAYKRANEYVGLRSGLGALVKDPMTGGPLTMRLGLSLLHLRLTNHGDFPRNLRGGA